MVRGGRRESRMQIKRVYTRHYHDNGQNCAYVEWQDGSRTEGKAADYHGVGLLFDRALAEGLTIKREVW